MHTTSKIPLNLEEQGFAEKPPIAWKGRSANIVTDRPAPISAANGISVRERDLFIEGVDSLRRKGPLALISVEAGRGQNAEATVRSLSRKIRSDIALYQHRAGMRRAPLWIEVLHAKARDGFPKLNSHIITFMPTAPLRDKLVEAVNKSTIYGRNAEAQEVWNVIELTSYLLQEMTPQAAWRTGIRRNKGSHPLGKLGGDRVRAAPTLCAMLVATEKVRPHRRTYAARKSELSAKPLKTFPVDTVGQGLLFDFPTMPSPGARLPSATVRRPRLKQPPSQMFHLLAPVPNVDVIEAMRSLGSTHQEIAHRVGISRAQVTDILNGQFGPSREVVQRVLEFVRLAA